MADNSPERSNRALARLGHDPRHRTDLREELGARVRLCRFEGTWSREGPRVRIRLPPAESQVRTCLSREFAFLRREAAVSAGVRAGASGAVGRDAQGAATSCLRAVISLSGYIPVPHRR